jgi:lipopolysaccharide/colanic/teichoic acid biosynthesis glycosyltransferase
MPPLNAYMPRAAPASISPGESGKQRRGLALIGRIRVQLLGGFLLAVLMPAVLRWGWETFEAAQGASLGYSILGTLIALVAGYFVLRQLIAFPGVEASAYIVPAFALSYGLLIAAMFFFRIDYSRYQLLASFAIAVVWFYWVYFVSRRKLRPRIALVPGGRDFGIGAIERIEVVLLKEPKFKGLGADAIVADLHSDLPSDWEAFIARAALKGIPVYHAKQIAESLTGKVEVQHLSENTFGSVLPSLLYAKLKRMIDVIEVVLCAVPFLIVIGMAAIAIKLDSPGPVFFLQRRMGYRGRVFTMVKLRTMRTAERDALPFTIYGDERVTRVGAFLRRYRIDEFPQIWNILKGEMSWIGPRPESLPLAESYQKAIPFYAYRHIVRPGITGWAQVNQGNVAEVEAATYKLHYDFYYIKHFSPWLDALIVAKTIRTMVTGNGSR